jgi:hypothetical protein
LGDEEGARVEGEREGAILMVDSFLHSIAWVWVFGLHTYAIDISGQAVLVTSLFDRAE